MSSGILWFDIHTRAIPPTRVEVEYRRDLRLIIANQLALTAHIDDDYFGYSFQRAANVSSVLPPFTAEEARTYDADRWTHAIARALRNSPASPLYAGTWALGPWLELCPEYARTAREFFESAAADREDGYTEWDIGDMLPPLLLRPPPSPSDARVKAWRKFARDRRLPPLLMWWVAGLDRFVVLDGAARLVAAIAEGIEPPALALAAARIETIAPDPSLRAVAEELANTPGTSLEALNRLAMRAYGAERKVTFVTRAWPMPRAHTRS